MPKDSLLDELNDLEGKKKDEKPAKKDETSKEEPKKEEPKVEPKAEEPKVEPKAEENKDKDPDINDPTLDVVLKIMDGDVDAARNGIASLTTNAVKRFVNGKELDDKPVSFGEETPKERESDDKESGSEPKDDE
jgi:hypothetical protein